MTLYQLRWSLLDKRVAAVVAVDETKCRGATQLGRRLGTTAGLHRQIPAQGLIVYLPTYGVRVEGRREAHGKRT